MTQARDALERRKRPDLRLVFDDVIERVAPFFREELDAHHTSLEFWAARTIRDRHPELSILDVQVLVNAAARYLRAEQAKARDAARTASVRT